MPLFGSSSKSSDLSDNPDIRDVQKRVSKEARADEKNLNHAISDLAKADKVHTKSLKVRLPILTRCTPNIHLALLLTHMRTGSGQGPTYARQGRAEGAQGRKGTQPRDARPRLCRHRRAERGEGCAGEYKPIFPFPPPDTRALQAGPRPRSPLIADRFPPPVPRTYA